MEVDTPQEQVQAPQSSQTPEKFLMVMAGIF